jgi:hypothetical protein
LEFIIDDIFVEVGATFSINHQHPQENKLCPLLTDLLFYSYEAEFIQERIKNKTITEAEVFNLIEMFKFIVLFNLMLSL